MPEPIHALRRLVEASRSVESPPEELSLAVSLAEATLAEWSVQPGRDDDSLASIVEDLERVAESPLPGVRAELVEKVGADLERRAGAGWREALYDVALAVLARAGLKGMLITEFPGMLTGKELTVFGEKPDRPALVRYAASAFALVIQDAWGESCLKKVPQSVHEVSRAVSVVASQIALRWMREQRQEER
jgi:hypothetical protein